MCRPDAVVLQRRNGNFAGGRLLKAVPAGMIQREVTTTIGTSKRKPKDITQILNVKIAQIIDDLELRPAKNAQTLEQLELAKTYLQKREAAVDMKAHAKKPKPGEVGPR